MNLLPEPSSLRNNDGVFGLLSLLTLSMTMLLYSCNSKVFRIFFGDRNPLFILTSLSILGLILVRRFEGLGFMVYRPTATKLRYRYFFLAVLLAIIMISIDFYVVFPNNINIMFPFSVLYYPIFGYVVEVLFHMTPLFLLLYVARGFVSEKNDIIIPGIMLLVSLFEPLFQVGLGFSSVVPTWTVYYVGIHIFLINFIQLTLFWRFDFVTMYAFRILYYLCWHIVWGYLRLQILF